MDVELRRDANAVWAAVFRCLAPPVKGRECEWLPSDGGSCERHSSQGFRTFGFWTAGVVPESNNEIHYRCFNFCLVQSCPLGGASILGFAARSDGVSPQQASEIACRSVLPGVSGVTAGALPAQVRQSAHVCCWVRAAQAAGLPPLHWSHCRSRSSSHCRHSSRSWGSQASPGAAAIRDTACVARLTAT